MVERPERGRRLIGCSTLFQSPLPRKTLWRRIRPLENDARRDAFDHVTLRVRGQLRQVFCHPHIDTMTVILKAPGLILLYSSTRMSGGRYRSVSRSEAMLDTDAICLSRWKRVSHISLLDLDLRFALTIGAEIQLI